MKIWALVLFAGISSLTAAESKADAQLERALVASLLFNEDPETSKLGTLTIGRAYKNDQQLTDLLAETMILSIKESQDRDHIDAFGHRVNMFADMRNARYRDALLQAQEIVTNPDWKKRIDQVVQKLGATTEPQYLPGKMDVAAKRAELEALVQRQKKADRSGFKDVHDQEPLAAVLERMGAPDYVSGITSYGKWGRAETFVAHYEGTGLVALRFDSQSSHWLVFEQAYELLPVKTLYKGEHRGLAQMVASFRGTSFRNVMKYYNRPMREEAAFQELLAQRVMLNNYVPDRLEDDGLVIATSFVNLLQTPNVEELLTQIAEVSGSKDARDAAETYLKRRMKLARRAAAKQ